MPDDRSSTAPVETFSTAGGRVLGYLGLAVAGVLVIAVAVNEPGLRGLRICLGAAIAAVLIWMTMLRPRAKAYAGTLVLRNMISDTHVPLARVEGAVVRHALLVYVGDDRHTCAGIGRSTRAMVRQQWRAAAPGQVAPAKDQDYADFVESRITDLAEVARRDQRGDPPHVRRVWAKAELVTLSVLTVAFAASLLF